MKKKLSAIFLCVALVAIAVVGASLAYFTDTKSATNTFTVGNVKINLIESKFHREGNDNSGDTTIPDPTHKVTAEDDMKYVATSHTMFTDAEIKADAETYKTDYLNVKGQNMVPGRGVAKCPYVVNTGANDAYVRIRVMAPHDYEGSYRGFINAMFCSTATASGEFQHGANGVNWPVIEENGYTDADGLKYDVLTFTRIEPLKAGAMTEWNVINYVGIGENVTSADIQTAVEKGFIKVSKDGTMTVNVLVQADAIQAEGFADAKAAFAAFDAQK